MSSCYYVRMSRTFLWTNSFCRLFFFLLMRRIFLASPTKACELCTECKKCENGFFLRLPRKQEILKTSYVRTMQPHTATWLCCNSIACCWSASTRTTYSCRGVKLWEHAAAHVCVSVSVNVCVCACGSLSGITVLNVLRLRWDSWVESRRQRWNSWKADGMPGDVVRGRRMRESADLKRKYIRWLLFLPQIHRYCVLAAPGQTAD